MDTKNRIPLRALDDPPALPTPLQPPRRRRSKLVILIGIVLSAVCAVGVVWVFEETSATVPVVGVAVPVRYGETIAVSALREVRVHLDPALEPVPWERRFDMIGRTATTDLLPGEIVTPRMIHGQAGPSAGQQLVGVEVKPGQIPSTPLLPRQSVLLVPAGTAGSAAEDWAPVRGTVLRLGEPDATGARVIDVVVADTDGPALATRASSGAVAIVLEGS